MNKVIVINKKKLLKLAFYSANFLLVILYLFPGSIIGGFLYNDFYTHPQITRNFMISSNHFYIFTVHSILGIFIYQKTKKINFLFQYLLLLAIILELFHFVIPNRGFEFSDLFGNLAGVLSTIIIYKIRKKYV